MVQGEGRLQVVTADCTPVVGARVDVWHCDAQGVYSGVENLGGGPDARGESFLRGTQMTDAAGVAAFQTIFPGWYPGRTTHVHYKVFLDRDAVLTSQIFFDEAVNQSIYDDHDAYAREGARDMVNAADVIAGRAGDGAYARVRMTEPDGAMEAALQGLPAIALSAYMGPKNNANEALMFEAAKVHGAALIRKLLDHGIWDDGDYRVRAAGPAPASLCPSSRSA